MDKQKIEEMARTIGGCHITANCKECDEKSRTTHCYNRTGARNLYNAGYRKIPENEVNTRKETAEKFAERLKEKLKDWLEDNEGLDGKIDFGIANIELIGVESLEGEVISKSLIDEICKEITEGKE